MFSTERTALLLLALALIVFVCVASIKSCQRSPIMPSGDSVEAGVRNEAVKEQKQEKRQKQKKTSKSKSKKTNSKKSSVSTPYQRSHRDEEVN